MNPVALSSLFDTPLYGELLAPPGSRAKLLIVHGISEHIGRYATTMVQLAARGIACYGYDQRGHGRSPGERTDIERFSILTDDLHTIIRGVAATHPELPLFVWGHSMGSLVVIDAAPAFAGLVRGVATTGCPLAAYGSARPLLMPPLRWVSNAIPTARVRSFVSARALSHDESVQRAYESDPLVVRNTTLRLLSALGETIARIPDIAPSLQLPWLAAHGSVDSIAPAAGSSALISQLGTSDKRLEIFQDARHELHNESEPTRGGFLDTLGGWVMDRATQMR